MAVPAAVVRGRRDGFFAAVLSSSALYNDGVSDSGLYVDTYSAVADLMRTHTLFGSADYFSLLIAVFIGLRFGHRIQKATSGFPEEVEELRRRQRQLSRLVFLLPILVHLSMAYWYDQLLPIAVTVKFFGLLFGLMYFVLPILILCVLSWLAYTVAVRFAGHIVTPWLTTVPLLNGVDIYLIKKFFLDYALKPVAGAVLRELLEVDRKPG